MKGKKEEKKDFFYGNIEIKEKKEIYFYFPFFLEEKKKPKIYHRHVFISRRSIHVLQVTLQHHLNIQRQLIFSRIIL